MTLNRTDLLANKLHKDIAERVMTDLQKEFDNAYFSIVVDSKTMLWKLYVTPKWSKEFNEIEVRQRCLILINTYLGIVTA